MASEIRVNTINNRSGLGTVSVTDTGLVVSGIITATTVNTSSTSTFSSGLNVTGVSTFSGDIISGTNGFFYDYSTGKLGVGIDPPGSTRLHVKGHSSLNNSLLIDVNTGDSTLGFAENGTEKWRIENVTSDDALRFYDVTNTAERLRITSGGNVGIGTDNPDVGVRLHIEDSSPVLRLNHTGLGTGDILGSLQFGSPGDPNCAAIYALHDGSTDSGALSFRTEAIGGNIEERLRITSGGVVQIGGDVEDAANDIDTSNTKLTIKQSGMGLEDGIYLERPNERRGHYIRVATSGTAQDALVFGTNQIVTETDHLLALDRGGNVTMMAGNVGIGTDNPTYSGVFGGSQKVLHISGTTAPSLRIQSSTSNQGDLSIQAGNSGADVQISNMATNGDIVFNTHPSGSINEAARFTDSGNLKFPSGQGIDFSATSDGSGTTTSELFDDYEEGTYTPNFGAPSGSEGSAAYTSDGKYVKIGQLVTAMGEIYITNRGSWSGTVKFGNLPFTAASGRQNLGACWVTNVSVPTQTFYQSRVGPSESYATMPKISNNGGDAYLQISDITVSSSIRFTVSYTTS